MESDGNGGSDTVQGVSAFGVCPNADKRHRHLFDAYRHRQRTWDVKSEDTGCASIQGSYEWRGALDWKPPELRFSHADLEPRSVTTNGYKEAIRERIHTHLPIGAIWLGPTNGPRLGSPYERPITASQSILL